MLVDSHCHLDFEALYQDLDGVIARAKSNGVKTLLTIGTKLSQAVPVIEIARAHENIFCTVGIHPHEAEREQALAQADRLIALAQDSNVVGIGESGLDFYYNEAPREKQIDAFRTHILAAKETGLPLVVHTRDADDETAEILKSECRDGRLRGVIHCFTSSSAFADIALDLGFSISFSGIVTFKNAGDLRDIARRVPDNRLLVETDSPYLAPVPMRGKSNEPSYVAHTAALLADIRTVDRALLAQQTTDNFFALFNRAVRPQ